MSNPPFAFTFKQLLQVLHRRRFTFALSVLIVLILAALWFMQQPAQYTATALLQINARSTQVLEMEDVISGLGQDQAIIQSEMNLMRSTHIARQVVTALNLTHPPNAQTYLGRNIAEGQLPSQNQRFQTIQAVQAAYRVHNPARSLTIEISARAPSPMAAAMLANTIAEVYLQDQKNMRTTATRQARDWLDERARELQTKVQSTEEAVQQFMQNNNLFEQQGLTLAAQQLAALNTQLISARVSRAEAQAKYAHARKLTRNGAIASAAEVIASPLIQELRAQEAIVVRKTAQLRNRYGPKHPKLQQAQAEQREIQEKIAREIQSIVTGYENTLAVAQAKEQALSQNLNRLKQDVSQTSAAAVKLAELQREASANRNVYEAFLTRSKELIQQENIPWTDAQFVAPAIPPLVPSHPKQLLVLAITFVLATGAGIAMVIAREALDQVFRTSEQLEQKLGVPVIAQIPALSPGEHVVKYILDHPHDAYTEAHRSIRAAFPFTNLGQPPQVIMVTSAVAGEGKSSTVAALAALMAKTGLKVLVLDADFRKPSLANIFGAATASNLAEVLTQSQAWQPAIWKEGVTQLHLIPSSPTVLDPHLIMENFQTLLQQARKIYDYILIDTPPLTTAADTLSLTQVADATLMVTTWGKTGREDVKQALKRLNNTQIPLVGIALTKVPRKQLKNMAPYVSNPKWLTSDLA